MHHPIKYRINKKNLRGLIGHLGLISFPLLIILNFCHFNLQACGYDDNLGYQVEPVERSDSAAERPLNVIVLVADDQRFDSLGVAGNPVIHTPRLDQMAAAGVHFTRAYVTTSICMTSRASILTGQHMGRHGIDQFGKSLTPDQFANSYPGSLRSAGYYSGFVGKYGVGAIRSEDFDFSRSYQGRHWMQVDGQRIHVTERNLQDALSFLRQKPNDQPFLLSVSFFAPHAEDSAPEQYLPQPWSASFYDGVTIPDSPRMGADFLTALPEFLQDPKNEGRVRYHWRFDTDQHYQESMRNYYRLITEVDQAVGKIIDQLEQQQELENTMIIYIGDNGYFHADRGLADKWYPYEESIRVPLIIFDPRLERDRRGLQVDQTVLNIDLAPTIISAASVPIPEMIQGRDLSPLYLTGLNPDLPEAATVHWREEFFYEHPTITSRDRIPASQAVVNRQMKYVYWPEWEHEQLFDLVADPDEKTDVFQTSQYSDQLRQLRRRLKQWKEDVK